MIKVAKSLITNQSGWYMKLTNEEKNLWNKNSELFYDQSHQFHWKNKNLSLQRNNTLRTLCLLLRRKMNGQDNFERIEPNGTGPKTKNKFIEMKKMIIRRPCWTHSVRNPNNTVTTNASRTGLRQTLWQKRNDNTITPIALARRFLNHAD